MQSLGLAEEMVAGEEVEEGEAGEGMVAETLTGITISPADSTSAFEQLRRAPSHSPEAHDMFLSRAKFCVSSYLPGLTLLFLSLS